MSLAAAGPIPGDARRAAALRSDAAARRIVLAGVSILFGGTACVNAVAALFLDDADQAGLHGVAAAIALLLLVECLRHVRRADALGLLAPPLLASAAFFFLSGVLPVTASLFEPWLFDRYAYVSGVDASALRDTLTLTGLAAFLMWRGYGLGARAGRSIRPWLRRAPWLRTSLDQPLWLGAAVQIAYVALVAYAVSLGVFGFAGGAEDRAAHLGALEAMRLALSAGVLSFFLIAVSVFERRAQGRAGLAAALALAGLTALHVLIGVLSGFKSQMVAPLAALGLASFVATRRPPVGYGLAALAALIAAYQIVEPFRAYVGERDLYGASDLVTLVGDLGEALEADGQHVARDESLPVQIIARFDLLGVSAAGVAFAERGGVDPAFRDQLRESLYLSPVLAVVPRALWPDKPVYSTGRWFNQTVLGRIHDDKTSVGMGPVAFLYMAGGVVGVALGFLGLGALQGALFEGVARAGAGGLVVVLSVLETLVVIPSDVGPALTGLLRTLPIAVLAQFALLRPKPARL